MKDPLHAGGSHSKHQFWIMSIIDVEECSVRTHDIQKATEEPNRQRTEVSHRVSESLGHNIDWRATPASSRGLGQAFGLRTPCLTCPIIDFVSWTWALALRLHVVTAVQEVWRWGCEVKCFALETPVNFHEAYLWVLWSRFSPSPT